MHVKIAQCVFLKSKGMSLHKHSTNFQVSYFFTMIKLYASFHRKFRKHSIVEDGGKT